MDLELGDKVALVAGASKGIGYGIAEAFVEEGARVMLTGRTEADLETARERLATRGDDRVAAFAGDMTATADIEAALAATVERFGTVDAVIANVGGGGLKPGWDLSDEDLEAAFEHNLLGTMRLARAALRHLEGREGTSLTVVSSIAGVDAMGAPVTYGIAKSGLNHYVTSLAKLVGPAVRVNAVAPGNIRFEGGSWDERYRAAPEKVGRWIEREVALERFGTPREIADVVAFLSSPRAAFVTGATWIVDGGQVRTTF